MKQDFKTSVVEEIKVENIQEQVQQGNVMNDPLMQNMQQENVAANKQIQGEEENIDRVLMSIEAGRYVQITSMDVRTMPVDEEERGFGDE